MNRAQDNRPRQHYLYSSIHGDWSNERRDFRTPEALTVYGIAVYSALCAAAGAGDSCDLSIPTIARMCACSEKKVREALDILQGLRLITVTTRRISTELHDTNLYTIHEMVGGVVPVGNQVVPVGNPNDSSSSKEKPPEKLNCGRLFEEAFGFLPSPFLVGNMHALEEEYGAVALTEAMRTAARAGKRDLRYVEGILRKQQAGDMRPEPQPEPERGRWI